LLACLFAYVLASLLSCFCAYVYALPVKPATRELRSTVHKISLSDRRWQVLNDANTGCDFCARSGPPGAFKHP
jgi:hypothetical protein